MKKLLVALIVSLLLFSIACSDSKSNKTKQDQEQQHKYGAAYMVYLSSIWQKYTVADVDPNFTYNGLAPGCECPPSLEATTGKTATYNPEFAFFVKRGAANNLLIFFMGGGACWNITNCAYKHTSSPQLFESNLILGLASTGGGRARGLGGIMDTSNANNPFKDWTVVWIPYCTGDLGMGQKDYEYTDDYQPGTYTGDKVSIRHRGMVNIQLVLQWLRNNITTQPDKLFVTGISAGSYSAILSFPMIRRVFNSSSTKAYVLGDAGVGVAGLYDADPLNPPAPLPFMQLIESIWGLQLPDHDVPGTVFYGKTSSDYSYEYKNLVQAIVSFYPNDRFAQYTTKWDKTQVWFYYLQKENNIRLPGDWDAQAKAVADPTSAFSIEWNTGMTSAINITGGNYWYYIGPGTHHTVDLSQAFYTETADGTSLLGWVSKFINDDTSITSQTCTSAVCDQP